MVFIIACLAVLLPVLLGGFLAWVTAGMDTRVNKTRVELEERDKGYNPALTFGHKIKAQSPSEAQLAEARRLAAKQAAATPRGANMQIGRLGQENLVTAGRTDALQNDPVTAVRIAAHHGWDGARTGAVAVTAAPAAAAPAAKAAAAPAAVTPGKDFPVIAITDSMSPEEIRKARIANAKAKSAAAKAAKAAGIPAAAPVAEAGAAQPVAVAAAPVATAVAIEPPQLIEISDGMSPDDVRKARIANSKATSAFNKALKAAGIDPKDVEIVDGQVVIPGGAPVMAAPAAVVAETVEAVAAPAAIPTAAVSAVPEPNYIEITDDMSPDDVRKARIQNSKLKSEYNKALKAAGIDPKAVS
ncbi:MAG TPA: hypothetical protein PLD25_14835 [Chloroflexota bacterium]|nr:hypothetical protein [Chloroflexota bacterium]